MQLGIYFDLRDPEPWRVGTDRVHGRALEAAEEADRRGLRSVWLSEHHLFADGYLPQPLVFAAAVAARTRTVRVGTAVLLAPLRPAIDIAEQAAVVDQLSGGRLELGLGAGYRVPEFEAFGVDPARRFALLEQRAVEVRALWEGAAVTPGPLQERPPIWVGAHGARGARLAGRSGAGLLSLNPELWAPYLEARALAGHPLAGLRVSGPLSVLLADDPERTRALVAPYAEHQWATYDSYAHEGAPEGPLTRLFAARGAGAPPPVRVLTVEQAAAELTSLGQRLPLGHVFLWERVAGMPDVIAERHVELLASGLAPLLADAEPTHPAAVPNAMAPEPVPRGDRR
ncbi:LLM class flavin-dependent oxidoreductase [Baekduia soli]|uniref:LLM class flavin-dependent oxidoreductase n=1 Tax=Baekduia soli TaxID=496014 RepID=A0A5B8UD11_9ACTN|nr:LLM class flavin-dependent oxidoreductase [Baekduia soli]QEC50571.1 LLM class flavin-dependent oxidoreductase [Baekduia soli]